MLNRFNNKRALSAAIGYVEKLLKERNIPGAQFAVVKNGKLCCLHAEGLANLEHGTPVTDTTIFTINSMAKAFTGIAVMQLVESGQVDLEAAIADYLDGLPESWRAITVKQLATLTSGVPEIMVYTADNGVALIGDGAVEGAWKAAYAAPMEYPTGKGYAYTQTNYALLGQIIAKVSGKPFEQFVAERQFAVAGMQNTGYFTDQDIVPGRADTYMSISVEGEPSGKIINSHMNWPAILRMAAGLNSTAEDLANWIIALQGGKLLQKQSSVETLQSPLPAHNGGPGIWGVGWLTGRSGIAGRIPAPAGGAKAQLAIYPDGLSVVLLTNLIGAFPEHLAPVTESEIDLGFIDPIAGYFGA